MTPKHAVNDAVRPRRPAGKAADPQDRLPLRAWHVLRDEGLRSFAMRAAAVLGYRRLHVLERPLAAAPAPPDSTGAFEVALLGSRDLAAYADWRGQAEALLRRRCESGAACFVARSDKHIVASCWAATTCAFVDYLGAELRLAPEEVYFFDAWTDPRWRGHGLAPLVCAAQIAHFHALGYRLALRGTLPENQAALKAHAKTGFRIAGVMGTLRVGPWSRSFQRAFGGALFRARLVTNP